MNNVQILVHPCPAPVRFSHEECWLLRKLVDPKRVGRTNEREGEEGKRKEGEGEREKEGKKGMRRESRGRERW